MLEAIFINGNKCNSLIFFERIFFEDSVFISFSRLAHESEKNSSGELRPTPVVPGIKKPSPKEDGVL
jgi:hypothetical protein